MVFFVLEDVFLRFEYFGEVFRDGGNGCLVLFASSACVLDDCFHKAFVEFFDFFHGLDSDSGVGTVEFISEGSDCQNGVCLSRSRLFRDVVGGEKSVGAFLIVVARAKVSCASEGTADFDESEDDFAVRGFGFEGVSGVFGVCSGGKLKVDVSDVVWLVSDGLFDLDGLFKVNFLQTG